MLLLLLLLLLLLGRSEALLLLWRLMSAAFRAVEESVLGLSGGVGSFRVSVAGGFGKRFKAASPASPLHSYVGDEC